MRLSGSMRLAQRQPIGVATASAGQFITSGASVTAAAAHTYTGVAEFVAGKYLLMVYASGVGGSSPGTVTIKGVTATRRQGDDNDGQTFREVAAYEATVTAGVGDIVLNWTSGNLNRSTWALFYLGGYSFQTSGTNATITDSPASVAFNTLAGDMVFAAAWGFNGAATFSTTNLSPVLQRTVNSNHAVQWSRNLSANGATPETFSVDVGNTTERWLVVVSYRIASPADPTEILDDDGANILDDQGRPINSE